MVWEIYCCYGPYEYPDRTGPSYGPTLPDRTRIWSYYIDFDKTKAEIRNWNDFLLKYFKSEKKIMSLHYFTKYTSSLISSRTCKFIIQCMKISFSSKHEKHWRILQPNNLTSHKVILNNTHCAYLLFAPFASISSMIGRPYAYGRTV